MKRVTIHVGKRSGKPCIRGLRITIDDILEMLSSGMEVPEILEDFPQLTREDIQSALDYATLRESKTLRVNSHG